MLLADIFQKAAGSLCSALMPCYLMVVLPIILLVMLNRAKKAKQNDKDSRPHPTYYYDEETGEYYEAPQPPPPQPTPQRRSMAKEVGREVAKGIITKAIKSMFKL